MIQGGVLDVTLAASIQDAIWNSLHIRKGSWFQRPSFGSDLHLLSREKQTNETLMTAKRMVEVALKWLIDSSRITDLAITCTYPKSGKLLIHIQGASSNEPISIDYFIPVVAPLEV